MLTINVKIKDKVVSSISFDGHACYDDYGKDIVCASASVSMLTTVNAILEFNENAISYTEGDTVRIENILKDEVTNKLLNNLVNVLEELEKQYPNNIKILKKEE